MVIKNIENNNVYIFICVFKLFLIIYTSLLIFNFYLLDRGIIIIHIWNFRLSMTIYVDIENWENGRLKWKPYVKASEALRKVF